MKQWFGIGGETLAEVKCFGSEIPSAFNMDFLEFAETPEEAFRKFYTRRCKELEKKLERAKGTPKGTRFYFAEAYIGNAKKIFC